MNELQPTIGQWYWHRDKGQLFSVVALEDDGTIELQHYDGDLEAADAEDWAGMDIGLAEPPENWTGPIDDVEVDDLGYSDTAMDRQSWQEQGQDLRRRPEDWTNDPENREDDPDDEGPSADEADAG